MLGRLHTVSPRDYRAARRDYAGIDIVDPGSGAVTEAPVFVAALGASSFTYAEAPHNPKAGVTGGRPRSR
jgi:hypothetical protein